MSHTSNQERYIIILHPGESQAFGSAEFQKNITLFDQGFGFVTFYPGGSGLQILGIWIHRILIELKIWKREIDQQHF